MGIFRRSGKLAADTSGRLMQKFIDHMRRDEKDKSLYHCMRPFFIISKFLRLSSFGVERLDIVQVETFGSFKETRIYSLATSRWCRAVSILLKLTLTIYLMFMVSRETRKNKVKMVLMHYLWRSTFMLFASYVIVVLWTLEFGRNHWISIFQQADAIHHAFRRLGRPLGLCYLPRLAMGMIIFHLIYAGIHCWFARVLNAREPTVKIILQEHGLHGFRGVWDPTVQFICLGTSFLCDYMCWFTWHFADCVRMCLAVYMWRLYSKLNRLLSSTEANPAQVMEVMQTHLKISGLLRSINRAVSPITFVGTIFAVIYAFFYVNYFIDGHLDPIRIALFTHFALKNAVIFLVSAQVNAKAHSVSEWLESIAGMERNEDIVPPSSMSQFMVFISQVYTRDTIGFKGFEFFTITTSFIATIVSVTVTYTVVIIQVASQMKEE